MSLRSNDEIRERVARCERVRLGPWLNAGVSGARCRPHTVRALLTRVFGQLMLRSRHRPTAARPCPGRHDRRLHSMPDDAA